MNLRSFSALAALVIAVSGFAQSKPRVAVDSGAKNEVVAGQLLVKFKPAALKQGPTAQVSTLPGGSAYQNNIMVPGWTRWTIPADLDPRKAARMAMKDPSVAYAQPVNRVSVLLGDPNDADWGAIENETTYPDIFLNFGTSTLEFNRLWHLDDDGALLAWNTYPGVYYTSATKPANAPMIAIIDSGCDLGHPDFMNAGGISTDTTMGGQINWSVSRHFANGVPDNGSWDDDNGHGTHAAGLALAAANNGGFNGHGVPGLGYNAQGMILKVIAQNGSGSDSDAAAAIVYAADNGADIINLSLGTTSFSQVFQDATTYAWQKGCLVIAAGNENGNGGGNLGPIYPAACSGALGVTANAPGYLPAIDYYTGYGPYVDLAAPGGDIVTGADYYIIQYVFSTTPRGYFYFYDHNSGSPPYVTHDYTYFAGTSMAAPQVAGAAALYYGKNGLRRNQGHANIRTYRALELSAYGAMGATSGGWEPVQGYGCLDAPSLLADVNSRGATVGSIEGIVYYGGTPVSNVQVRAQRSGTSTYLSTTTLADGTYRFDGMLPGSYTVQAAPFGSLKTKKTLVYAGSDATGVDFWALGNPFDATPPEVPIFTIGTVTANSVSFSQWGYDPEDGIDSLKIRIGTTPGAQDTLADTDLITETTAASIGGFTLQPSTSYYLRATYTNGSGLTTIVDRTLSLAGGTTIGPSSFQIFRGQLLSGGLTQLQQSDDQYLAVKIGLVLSLAEPPIQVITTGTSPTATPGTFKIHLEGHAQISGITQTIQLWDYVAAGWVTVDTRIASSSDQVVEVTPSTPARFIQSGTRQIQARFQWKANGPITQTPWNAYIDQAVWIIG